MSLFLGVDPGVSGAMALVDARGRYVSDIRNKEPLADICDWVDRWSRRITHAVLEQVHAMPKQGVSSTFKFGTSFGICQGILSFVAIPWEMVSPGIWQRKLGCLTKGDKNITRTKASMLFPDTKIVHANADALLIAEYCRRLCAERGAA